DVANTRTDEDFIWAERERAAMFQRLSQAFEQVDVIVMPTVCCTAFSVEKRGPRVDGWSEVPPPWFQQCWGTVLTSCPILAIPAGLAPNGMPVGLQIIAPVRREDMALAAGRMIEAAVGTLPAIDPRPAA
ncbi:MAG: amidase family protein, partial [Alphaproteobacteria bacterium]|nr:amidase family protein [Alphaproteobacteria bacterium]